MIDGGKLVPVVPAVPIDGGNVVPIIQGHGSQRPRWCRSCRPCRPCRPCRSTPGSCCRSSRATGGNGRGRVADDRRREAVADHPGPRATACNGRGGARRADRPRERRAAPRQPGMSCRSSTWLRGARAGACNGRGRARGAESCRSSTLPRSCPTAGSWCPWCPCRSTAGRWCRASTAGNVVPAVPIIDLAAVLPYGGKLLPIIDLAARCPSCRPCRSSTLPRSCPTAGSWCPWCRSTPGSCCRSSRATACNGRGGARGAGRASTAGKLLPIIQGHGSQRPRWCPSCRSTPGRWCRSSTWLRGPGLLPMIDAGKVVPIIDLAARSGPVADDRRREAVAGSQRLPSCRPCRSTAGNVVPIIQGHGWQRPPSCPWCRSTPGSCCRSSAWLRGPGLLPMIDGGKLVPSRARADRRRERRADHPGPRLATAAVVPVVPVVPIDNRERRAGRADRQPGSCCRSSRATGGNGRGGARRAGRADHRPCRGPARRREAVADHRPGCAVRAGCR